jgi:hypothetical protein
MGRHIADQPRGRAEGTRFREYTRIERELGAVGPHPATRNLQRRHAEALTIGRRVAEFLRRDRHHRG